MAKKPQESLNVEDAKQFCDGLFIAAFAYLGINCIAGMLYTPVRAHKDSGSKQAKAKEREEKMQKAATEGNLGTIKCSDAAREGE